MHDACDGNTKIYVLHKNLKVCSADTCIGISSDKYHINLSDIYHDIYHLIYIRDILNNFINLIKNVFYHSKHHKLSQYASVQIYVHIILCNGKYVYVAVSEMHR